MVDNTELLQEIRGLRKEITGLNTRLSSLEGSLASRPCFAHSQEWTAMRTDIALLKQGVQIKVARITGLSALVSAALTAVGAWLVFGSGLGPCS